MKKVIIASLIVTSTLANANDIQLSRGIKSDLRAKIERDMDALDNLKFKPTAEVGSLKVMGLETLNAQTASKWLNERVNYVIEENALSVLKLLIKKTIQVEREGVSFPNAGVLPYSLDPKNKASTLFNAAGEGVVVMSNIGSGLYMAGKNENKVYALKVSRGLLKKATKVVIESPRAGIIQIGEGLFMKEITINNENPASIANSINRLGTFFHEAKHSDGNGSSLGFAHSLCPAGHDYAGAYACDESVNGPYTVGAIMMKEMLKSCNDTCTPKEKEILKIVILDSESRIMLTTRRGTPAEDWDSTPESL
ncbi:MAG: hypothetical protein H7336_10250 [Bacteriovorax sp.]|nr:hypothetical protein [Bacteriovorax sp.]